MWVTKNRCTLQDYGMSIAKYWVPLNIPSNTLVSKTLQILPFWVFRTYKDGKHNEIVPFQISCVAPSWPNLRRDLIIKCLGDSSFNVRTQVSPHELYIMGDRFGAKFWQRPLQLVCFCFPIKVPGEFVPLSFQKWYSREISKLFLLRFVKNMFGFAIYTDWFPKNQKQPLRFNNNNKIIMLKVFRYSFSEAIPIFF